MTNTEHNTTPVYAKLIVLPKSATDEGRFVVLPKCLASGARDLSPEEALTQAERNLGRPIVIDEVEVR